MSAVAFDTLKFAQTLRDKARLTPEQAEGIAAAFAEATAERLATKEDLVTLATKADVARLETNLAEVKADILKWLFSMIGFQTIVIPGAVVALAHFAR